jgi:hypothetical protein
MSGKTKTRIMVSGIFLVIFCFAGGALYAGTEVQDVIKMENKAYEKHKKSIVMFTHKKHAEDYKIGCGECHHDEKGKPLENLKYGDDVKGCIDCHAKPGERPKGKGQPKLTKKERLAYHAEAIHYNCRDCHKAFNKEKGLKSKDPGAAPTSCNQCHPKGKK